MMDEFIWINQRDKVRSGYPYWYRQYPEKYHSKFVFPASEAPEIKKLRGRLQTDKRVKSVELEHG
jgi:hypothetical protein